MKELADILGISLSTIRRDIQILEQNGAVRSIHSGAVRMIHDDYDAPVARKKL